LPTVLSFFVFWVLLMFLGVWLSWSFVVLFFVGFAEVWLVIVMQMALGRFARDSSRRTTCLFGSFVSS